MKPFTCLVVDIPRASGCISLYDCMKETFLEEVVADGWSCSNCHCVNGRVQKERFFKELPS